MTKTITITTVATLELPIAELADAVGGEIERSRRLETRAKISHRTATRELFIAIEEVVNALNKLEISANTLGERAARDRLMRTVSELRVAYANQRIKDYEKRP